MKKFLVSLIVVLAISTSLQNVSAMSYEEASKQNKPVAMLVYADWADDLEAVKENFNALQQQYSNTYNFVLLDIASPETKEFNKKYHIYPNLPYVLLYKDGGKVSRYLHKSCVLDSACLNEKASFFIN